MFSIFTRKHTEPVVQNDVERLIAASPTALIYMNPDRVVTHISDAALTLLGARREDVLGRVRCHELCRTPICDTSDCPMSRIAAATNRLEDQTVVQTEVQTASGRRIPVTVGFSVLRGDSGEIMGYIEHLLDKSTLMATIQDIERLIEAAALGQLDQRADESKVSGEFKTVFTKLNVLLDNLIMPLDVATEALGRIAEGDLPEKITGEYHGRFNTIATSLNQAVVTLGHAADHAHAIAEGDYDRDYPPCSDKDRLGAALQKMTASLRDNRDRNDRQEWLQEGLKRLNEVVLGEQDLQVLADNVISEAATRINAQIGALYISSEEAGKPELRLLGTYAYARRKGLSNVFLPGEGLVGQAALERKQILVSNVPDDYVYVVSGLGETPPRHICVIPFMYEGRLMGVLEVGLMAAPGERDLAYLEMIVGPLAAAFEMTRSQTLLQRQQTEMLTYTEELRSQAAALQESETLLKEQKEELNSANSELQAQMERVKESEERLKEQQAELEEANTELQAQMEKARESEERLKEQQAEMENVNVHLEEKNTLLERQKRETEQARLDMARQAEDLARASRYKSEFLANMSHELRTPLNSLLLLARALRDNAQGNLTEDQVESAGVIYDSGNDLLNLINDILDLSKIEAGRMDVRLEEMSVSDLAQSVRTQFGHMAAGQGLELDVRLEEDAPEVIVTDPQRLGQIIKNLMGNALKFTEKGRISVVFSRQETMPGGAPGETSVDPGIPEPGSFLVVQVRDTGIGIPRDKQDEMFEAFRQAEAGDNRQYGGSGLGLTISRELATLIGGEISLESEPGAGSTFTLVLPRHFTGNREERPGGSPGVSRPARSEGAGAKPPSPIMEQSRPVPRSTPVPDDRDNLEQGERCILLVEDDPRFAKILRDHVRARGFKCLVAMTGEEGLEMAGRHHPVGIILDIQLPRMDGWTVLGELKQDMDLRHIPVHIVSVVERSTVGLRLGAVGHAVKPLQAETIDMVLDELERAASRRDKRVLVVDDDEIMSREVVELIGNDNVTSTVAKTGSEALEALRRGGFDLVVLDLGLPDIQGLNVLRTLSAEGVALPPVIVNTARELTVEEEQALRNYSDSIIVKDVRSQERLIDEVTLFLHRVVQDLPRDTRRVIEHLHESDEPLRGRKVLLVEDDMRTLFAMSRLLAEHGMEPVKADNGVKALAVLDEQPDVDIVLMDMMMPVMDGYEAMRRIRAQERFAGLPVIALTAKAMKEDRAACIAAGANDYLAKPVDPERLASLMRVWLSR
ncbi:response regulator [Desulfonatronovibrio magnus]|uniref:response regulator n=1 Tax=Desulfonatronovibrio magnus TaxID=698827 RepID=UPI000695EF5B|nr:response regulator [Desulfonatronovibrio magnus]